MRVANQRLGMAQTESFDPHGLCTGASRAIRGSFRATMGSFREEKVTRRVYCDLAPQGTAKRTISRRATMKTCGTAVQTI